MMKKYQRPRLYLKKDPHGSKGLHAVKQGDDGVDPHLKKTDLVKRSSRMGWSTRYHFFLFSDVIIYTKAASSQPDFKIHEELPLHFMKITDWFPDKRQQMKTAFHVHHPRKSFIVFADSVEERQSWLKDIREAIVKEVERLAHLENARLAAASVER
jgi:hypothetical protein